MKPIIYPYALNSHAAKALSESLDTKRVRPNGTYKHKPAHCIINLGNSQIPNWNKQGVRWINHPNKVALAINKHTTFQKLQEHNVAIPAFTTDKKQALEWLKQEKTVVCRELLCASQGKGIVIATKPDELSNKTKLFVLYFPKKHEFRVHLVRKNGKLTIFDFVQKKKRADIPNDQINYKIRNHGQFIFARENVKLPKCVQTEAIKAGEALGLDLCSVDICYSEKHDKCVVLELNTSSGLEGQTITNYTKAITELCNEKIHGA